ncbi:MAG: GNAT family N-acetyltransferase [Gemmatimonadaceae bacterium]
MRREYPRASEAGEALQISVVDAADLTSQERAEVLALCTEAYEEDFTSELELLVDATHLLARVDGELVSHAAYVPRELRVGDAGAPLHCAYVEAVATRVRWQGLGYGSTVMRAIPPLLATFDIAALSPSDEGFYSRLGWLMWRGPRRYLQDGVRVETPEEEVMVYRLVRTTAGIDLEETLEIDWRPGEVW